MTLFLLLFAILLFLLFALEIHAVFYLNTDEEQLHLKMSWLAPFIKLEFALKPAPCLSVYLFNKRIHTGLVKQGKKVKTGRISRMELIRCLELTGTTIKTSYGFGDPSSTGLAFGIMGILGQFADIDSLSQDPDFISDTDYISIYATAEVNIGLTLVNLIRTYIKSSGSKLAYQGR